MEKPASEQDALAGLYEATAPAIRAYIRRHCSDRDAVDDLVQITYVKFLGSRMARGSEERESRAYLYRIASNVIADHGRALKRREQFERTEQEFTSSVPEEPVPEGVALLRDALGSLSRREQQLLWLLYAEEFAHKEVARIMGLSPASVRVLSFRARKKLSERLPQTGRGDARAGE